MNRVVVLGGSVLGQKGACRGREMKERFEVVVCDILRDILFAPSPNTATIHSSMPHSLTTTLTLLSSIDLFTHTLLVSHTTHDPS